MLSFLRKHLLEGLVIVAATGAAATWLEELATPMLPAAGDYRCWIEERWRGVVGDPRHRGGAHFAVLIARLHGDDPQGSQTRHLLSAFYDDDEHSRGFRALDTCRTVSTEGANLNAAWQRAEKLRASRGADLILWGEVAERDKSLRIWMTAPDAPRVASPQWTVDGGVLARPFRESFATALQAVTFAALERAEKPEGKPVADILESLLPRVSSLADKPPDGLNSHGRGNLFEAAGRAFHAYNALKGDKTALREAVRFFEAASRAYDRGGSPLEWARAQNSLGAAYGDLGLWEGRAELLWRAVEAHRHALDVHTLDGVPFEHARTLTFLGRTLSLLGANHRDDQALGDAIDHLRTALRVQELARKADPLGWDPLGRAQTQAGLGEALKTFGERHGDEKALRSAVHAQRAALEGYARERVPLGWGAAQISLGDALSTLGRHIRDAGALKDALEAYRAALEEITLERDPFSLFSLQNNLCETRRELGKVEGSAGLLRSSVQECEKALEGYRSLGSSLYAAVAQSNIGVALVVLAERHGDADVLPRAVTMLRESLRTFHRHSPPMAVYPEQAEQNLATARDLLG